MNEKRENKSGQRGKGGKAEMQRTYGAMTGGSTAA
jgi:hypothetical protein